MRLVPDCGGPIERIAIAVPPLLFGARPQARAARRALGNLAAALPADVTLVAITECRAEATVRNWLAACSACRVEIAATAPDGAMRPGDIWIQDTLHVTDAGFMRAGGARAGDHAEWLAAHEGRPIVTTGSRTPSGGNMLVGDDFRLVGSDSAAAPDLDPRPPLDWSYRLAGDRTRHQYLFHLDLVTSLTGLARGGAPLVLLAEAEDASAPGCRPAWADICGRRAKLDATAAHLEAQGLAVMRNPVPLRADADGHHYGHRAYNNILVENDLRPGRARPLVWMPAFGPEEPAFAGTDRRNAAIWEKLGFEVVSVPGWAPLAAQSGALRCASKVLRRRARTVPEAPCVSRVPAGVRAASADGAGSARADRSRRCRSPS